MGTVSVYLAIMNWLNCVIESKTALLFVASMLSAEARKAQFVSALLPREYSFMLLASSSDINSSFIVKVKSASKLPVP